MLNKITKKQILNNYQNIYDKYFNNTMPKSRFIFTPHASYQYSGFASFVAYSQIDWENIDTIILLSTNHFIDKNITPNNIITNNSNFIIKNYRRSNNDDLNIISFDNLEKETNSVINKEHSWRFQLPLLKYFINKYRNLNTIHKKPLEIELLLIRHNDDNLIKDISNRLVENKKTILIGNSDLSHINGHFGETIFGKSENIIEKIRITDARSLAPLLQLNSNKEPSTSACGSAVIKMFINIILSSKELKLETNIPKLMIYYNSIQTDLIKALNHTNYDIFNPSILFKYPYVSSKDAGVGYGALVFFPRKINNKLDTLFSNYEQYYMTNYCYKHLEMLLINREFKRRPFCINFNNLEVKKGLFITINKNNVLRGCIGSLNKNESIFNNLYTYTYNSAFNDSRFSPVKKDEFDYLNLYISILDSKKEVSYDFYMKNYNIGIDGIEVEFSNKKSAFFLPSVGTDIKNENPDMSDDYIKTHLLELLCIKAGINDKKYYKKEDTKYYMYIGHKIKDF